MFWSGKKWHFGQNMFKFAKAKDCFLSWFNAGTDESQRSTEGSVEGRAESTQGQITEARTALQQTPEPQLKKKTDEHGAVDCFYYFACPQSQDIL